ncbi:MAG: hypothetical protein QNL43_09165 [Crocinitomicaceae bacterium]|tara:strand:- start:34777 stop:35289 length:513 start_codon:yes stop_codon:yes gene_type:complete
MLNIKTFLFFLLGFVYSDFSYTQDSKTQIMGSVGVSYPLLDNGLGVQAGVNASYQIADWFEFEGQLSYQRSEIEESFFSNSMLFYGNSKLNSIALLSGGRFYLLPKAKKTRLYLNLLLGGLYTNEKADGFTRNIFNTGVSLGLFVQCQKLVFGLSLEAPQFLTFKIGYRF